MINVVLVEVFTVDNWVGNTEAFTKEKIVGTFVDDSEAKQWAENEKRHNPIFAEKIDGWDFPDGEMNRYELRLEPVNFITNRYRIKL